jgi:Leucine-rich repeat (LRR) protein
LVGRIPSENGKLTSLQIIQLEKNHIEGSLPSELCQLSNLLEFDIGTNHVSGKIPPCIGEKWTNLQTLHLHRNQLTGSIPTELSRLQELLNWNMGHNQLVGEAASLFGSLPKIQNMLAPGNQLEGIVDEKFFAKSSNLINLNMADNKFTSTDTLPSHLFNSMPNLKILALSKNNLHGKIPEVTNSDSSMLYLSLYDNYLSGSITRSISNFKSLQHLDLTNNQLSGEIPTEMGTMSALKFLSIGNNEDMSPSPIPTFLSQLGNLKYLSLRHTNRNASIPLNFPSSMKGLQYLDLSSNKLTGPLPIEMYALTKLEVLLLNSNQIDGAVMGATGNWEALHVALLDGMELRGNLSPMCEFISAERNELLYADCDGDTPFVECSCCKCCVSGQSGCSRDYVADLDKRLEYVYRTSDFITSLADALHPNFSGSLCSKEGICS